MAEKDSTHNLGRQQGRMLETILGESCRRQRDGVREEDEHLPESAVRGVFQGHGETADKAQTGRHGQERRHLVSMELRRGSALPGHSAQEAV